MNGTLEPTDGCLGAIVLAMLTRHQRLLRLRPRARIARGRWLDDRPHRRASGLLASRLAGSPLASEGGHDQGRKPVICPPRAEQANHASESKAADDEVNEKDAAPRRMKWSRRMLIVEEVVLEIISLPHHGSIGGGV